MKDRAPPDERPRRKGLAWRWLTILAALLAMAAIISRIVRRTEGPSGQVAQLIASGEAHQRALTEEDAGDQNLADDEAAAGEMWAEQHLEAGSGACPNYTQAFRRGCVDRMNRH